MTEHSTWMKSLLVIIGGTVSGATTASTNSLIGIIVGGCFTLLNGIIVVLLTQYVANRKKTHTDNSDHPRPTDTSDRTRVTRNRIRKREHGKKKR